MLKIARAQPRRAVHRHGCWRTPTGCGRAHRPPQVGEPGSARPRLRAGGTAWEGGRSVAEASPAAPRRHCRALLTSYDLVDPERPWSPVSGSRLGFRDV
jgi:hypothetical protein